MARYQYRYHGRAAWQSQSGNAIVALQNKLGSGKKLIVHSVEIQSDTRGTTAQASTLQVMRSTVIKDGEILPLAKCDSNATLPTGVSLQRDAVLYPPLTSVSAQFPAARLIGWHAGLGKWASIDDAKIVYTSANGVDWEPVSNVSNEIYYKGCYSSTLELMILVGWNGIILTSDDLITWTSQTSGVAATLRGVTWSSTLGMFVVVGDSGTILTSSDGESWTPQTSGLSSPLQSATWSATLGLFVISGAMGVILTSSDGISWTSRTSNVSASLKDVIWSSTLGLFVAVGSLGTIITSSNGTSWTTQTSNTSQSLEAVVEATDWAKVYAISSEAYVSGAFVSTNGTSWAPAVRWFKELTDIGYSEDIEQLLCTSSSGTALTNDGSNWIFFDYPLRSTRLYHQASSSRATLGAAIGPAGNRKLDTALFSHRNLSNDAEPLILRPGEALAFVHYFSGAMSGASHMSFADVSFVVDGTPKRTYSWSGVVWPISHTGCPLAIVNNSATDVVRVKSFRIHDAGSTDSPYFRLIPIGAINPDSLSDSLARLPVVKLDGAAPDLDEDIAVLVADAPIQPYGVPEAYIADSSAGAPKGMNYLQTKDFVGPQYAVVFGEYTGSANPGVASDKLLAGIGPRGDQIKGFRDPIIVREGEAIGIVSSAELATGASSVGTSGWGIWDIGITFSVEPTVIPSITVTGIVSGSDVVILDAGTSTVLAQVDQNSGTTWAWEYDADFVDTVDICVYKAGYIPYVLRNIDPGNAGITLPVAQVADRNYVA